MVTRQRFEHRFHILDEAEAHELVGFVEDDLVDLREFNRVAAQVIEKPAGRRDDELRLLAELILLPLDILSAVNERRSYAGRIRKRLGNVRRLHGQLARRADDKSLRYLGISLDAFDQGQQEGERLARARLERTAGIACSCTRVASRIP